MSSRTELLIDLFLRLGSMAQMLWRLVAIGCLLALCCSTFASRVTSSCKTDTRVGRIITFLLSDAAFCTFSAFVILLLRIPCLTLPQCNVDEGQWIAGANTLWDDPRFWGSVDGITSGPLVIYSLLSAKLFGTTIDYVSARCLANGLWAAIAIFTYATFRLLSPVFVARLLVLPLIATTALFSNQEYVGYNGEHVPIFHVVCRILAGCNPADDRTSASLADYSFGFHAGEHSLCKTSGRSHGTGHRMRRSDLHSDMARSDGRWLLVPLPQQHSCSAT